MSKLLPLIKNYKLFDFISRASDLARISSLFPTFWVQGQPRPSKRRRRELKFFLLDPDGCVCWNGSEGGGEAIIVF